MTDADLREREERLTALCKVLGFTSLDHLEDFVVLHGAARVVPASSVAAAGASLPLEDTQAQGCSYSETTHAQRNDDRKRENLRLKSEVEEVRKELNWLRREHEKHVDTIDALKKDKTRLLDLIDAAEKRAEAAVAQAGGGGNGDSFADEALALYDRIDELDAVVVGLEDEVEQAWEAHDDVQAELAGVKSELDEALQEVVQSRTEIDGLLAECDRLTALELELGEMKRTIGTLTALAARPSPAPSSTARPVRPFARSALSNATPNATPSGPSRLGNARVHSNSRSTPQPLAASVHGSVPAPSTPSAAQAPVPPALVPLPLSPATSNVVETRNASPSPPTADDCLPIPPRDARGSLSPRAVNQESTATTTVEAPPRNPSTLIPTSMAVTTASNANAVPGPSALTPRITSVQSRQLRLYPQVQSAYLEAVKKFSIPQQWAHEIIPTLDASLLSLLPPPPQVPVYPSVEFPAFESIEIVKLDDSKTRSPWIEDGTLEKRYRELEECEKKTVRRVADWKAWIDAAKLAGKKQDKAGSDEVKGKGKEKAKDQDGQVPGTTLKALVRKRRRISKEGVQGTPTTAVAPLTSSNLASISKAPSSSATVFSPATSTSGARRTSPLPNSAEAAPDANGGETQLPPSPAKPQPAQVVDGVPTTTKKKRWNLLSPRKKSTGAASTPTGPPRKASPNKASEGVKVLVDDTQPQGLAAKENLPQARPAFAGVASSSFGEEPDTLRSTEEGEPDTLVSSEGAFFPPDRPASRSTSRSPRKKGVASSSSQSTSRFSPTKKSPLRRTSAIAHDTTAPSTGPKPPFSPSYATKMARRAAIGSVPGSPPSSPPPPSPRLPIASTSRVPFQPSPNRHVQSSRSPSSSPLKASLPMPPSAQPTRLSRNGVNDLDAGIDSGRGLLFSIEPSLSPDKKRARGKGRAAEVFVKEEEDEEEEQVEDDPFAVSGRRTRARISRTGGTPSPSPKKQKRRSDGNDETRSAKRPKTTSDSGAFDGAEEDEEEDIKPSISLPDSEDLGQMPMGPAEEAGRKLWIQKLQAKRHEKIVKEQQAKASKNLPRVQVEINPERNQGQKHAFKQTERRKAVRQSMVAEACSNCKAYYDRKKQPVPAGHCNHVAPPTADTTSKAQSKGAWLDTRAADAEKRMQQDGRHRAAQRTVPDPPDYWQMGFPSTQQLDLINTRAKQQKADQEAFKRIEAE